MSRSSRPASSEPVSTRAGPPAAGSVRRTLLDRLRGDQFRDPWKQHQYRSLAADVASELSGAPSVVDLGCGEGLFSSCLREALDEGRRFLAMDIVADPSWSARGSGIHFVVGDASRPPFRPGAASVAIAKDLLHHMDEPALGVRWLTTLADERVVVIEANLDNPIMALYTRHNGDRHMTSAQLMRLLGDSAPQLRWTRRPATAYPFYLPPVTNLSALWVWPVTGAMLVLFKVVRSQAAARWLAAAVSRLRWEPPFNIVVGTPSA